MRTSLQNEACNFNWLRFQLRSGRAALTELDKCHEYLSKSTYQRLSSKLFRAHILIIEVLDEARDEQFTRMSARTISVSRTPLIDKLSQEEPVR